MDGRSIINLLLIIMFAIYVLIYVLRVSATLIPVGVAADRAFRESDFPETEYWIYDKTAREPDEMCNRLIVVKPFEWYILNVNRQLYVIDPDRPIKCGESHVSALRILKDTFIECCMSFDFDTLLLSYDVNREQGDSETEYVKIPFKITGDRFTVLTAINQLCEEYVDFEPHVKSTRSIGQLENIYSMHGGQFNITNLGYVSRFTRSLEEEHNREYNSKKRLSPHVDVAEVLERLYAVPSESEVSFRAKHLSGNDTNTGAEFIRRNNDHRE